MKTFKHYSAAVKAAGDRPILRIAAEGKTLYIVADFSTCSSVDLLVKDKLSETTPSFSRLVGATVGLGNFARLGNANWAKKGENQRGCEVEFLATSGVKITI